MGVMSARAGVRRLGEVVERHRSRMVEGCEEGAKAVSRRVSITGKMVVDGRVQWGNEGAKDANAILDAFFELVQLEVQLLVAPVGQCCYSQ